MRDLTSLVKSLPDQVLADLKSSLERNAGMGVEQKAGDGHEPMTGTHTHVHAAMGSQGDDATHEHEHTHAGDASHDHQHGKTAGRGAQKSGRVLSAENASKIQLAHAHMSKAVEHMKAVMEAAGVDPLDAGFLDNITNPLDATDPDNDGDGDKDGGGSPQDDGYKAFLAHQKRFAEEQAKGGEPDMLDLDPQALGEFISRQIAEAMTQLTGRLP